MSSRDTDARPVGLVDIPLVMRLTDASVVLDSALAFTRDVRGPNGALLTSILLPQRGLHTLLARSDKQQVIGQFRVKNDEPRAQIIYVAPGLEQGQDDTAWLQIFDAMTREAGKHNVHALIAEIEEDSTLFETMRTAGFAVYARQQIWRRLPHAYQHPTGNLLEVRKKTEADFTSIQSLFATTVPSLLQQIVIPDDDDDGLVYRKNNRVEAYFTLIEGRNGIYLIPYLHDDISSEAPDIFAAVLRALNQRIDKVPLYMCVRRYQDWFTMSLRVLGFEPGPRQAVMVRHLTAGVRHARFKSVEADLQANPVKPPTRP